MAHMSRAEVTVDNPAPQPARPKRRLGHTI